MPRARAVGIDARWINANGGIAGHPLHVTVCDDGGVASQAAARAREAVSGNDVAVVGSFSIAGDPAGEYRLGAMLRALVTVRR